jgi:hypothetical protein
MSETISTNNRSRQLIDSSWQDPDLLAFDRLNFDSLRWRYGSLEVHFL